MLRLGLLGWPVKHSVSPPMQEAGCRALGLEASYVLLPTPPEELAAKVAAMRSSFAGWNVTIPHKGGMAALVDEVTPAARAAESVNTVVNRDGRLYGHSTDGYGLETAVRENFGVGVAGANWLFWGTGGAARATSVHVALGGARAVTLVNRTVAKAETLAAGLRALAPACTVRVLSPDDLAGLAAVMADTSVLVQCTSVGLHADDPLSVPEGVLRPSVPVLEMIYRPTKLLTLARARGIPAADGRGMLLYQGARSLELWTGRPAPVAAMRVALNAALDG